MSFGLEILIKDILSPINDIRKSAEIKFNQFYENMTIKDIDNLLNEFIKSKNENVKLFICITIKKFINEKINENNNEAFIQYFSENKINYINILLYNEVSSKLIKNFLTCLFDALELFKLKENLYIDNICDIFLYFSQYYSSKKNANDIKEVMKCLFIFEKFIKFIQKVTVNQKLDNLIKTFYLNIIEDYKEIISNINNEKLNKDLYLEIVIYYLKLFKHSNNFLDDSYSDLILNNTYNLNVFILNKLISNNITNENEKVSKLIFDIIFLSNKIIILYISNVKTLSIETLKKYAEIFYIFIKEENVFNYINNIIKNSKNIPESMEYKFLFDIINFFYELLQLSSLQEFTELQIFGNGFTDNAIEISDFFRNKYWDKEKIKMLLLFILKNCFALKAKDIEIGMNEPEDFYLWFYNSDAYHQDLRGKAGKICRIIYDIFRKEVKDIYLLMENELYSLTKLENELINRNLNLNDDQINNKFSLLLYYYYVDTHFSSKKLDKQKWIENILLSQIENNVIKRKKEIFSSFIIMYILSKINSYISDENMKNFVFLKIMDVFLCKEFDYLLLDLSSIDFIYDYVEEEVNKINLPKNIINGYIIKICQILGEVSSPDIYNKIIETTNSLLNKTIDDELNLIFPEVFPILQKIWLNNENNIIKNYNNGNKLMLIKGNLIKLIELFVKKFGFFVTFDDYKNNENKNIINKDFYENYFNFIYQMIGYSINVKSPSNEYLCKNALDFIIFIQDDFVENSPLSIISDINDLHNNVNSFFYFPYFIKIYDYLDIILSNLSDSNQYFILQFAIIEQFISLSFEKEINLILENINFIEKIIYIFNYYLNNYINQYSLYIFNVIEYIYYIILSHSKINEENKKKLNDYIYQIIQNKFGDKDFESNINNIFQTYEQNIDDIFFGRDENNYLINIYIGFIQIANRYIFINAYYYKNINNDLNIFIATKIISLSKFLTKKCKVLNIIQKTFLQNCIFNLKYLIDENNNKDIYNALNQIYNNIAKSHYISKNDKILGHWLFFFNKIYNEYYTSKLESEEETLRYFWKTNIEKDVQLIDNINKEYKIKFLMLASDVLYNNEK